jgi:hypothetical protein
MHNNAEIERAFPVQVRLKDNLLSAVDAWRRAQPDLPTRPEAVRRLIDKQLSLAAEGAERASA